MAPSDNLDKYVPEFDEQQMRARVAGMSRDQLLDMLMRSYKQVRILGKQLEQAEKRFAEIRAILDQPSDLLSLPGIPTADDIRRMMEE
ncbi:hypothetical protein ACFQBQ_12805 [Granulicella cerasi]|uniref:Uncharacterized protein n=1 Tax=Granulicella cerasi TaxID=741063 RepID=A0ABW1ZE27_9BACT|nr:hypothetical protein [Granulicella cerasi]